MELSRMRLSKMWSGYFFKTTCHSHCGAKSCEFAFKSAEQLMRGAPCFSINSHCAPFGWGHILSCLLLWCGFHSLSSQVISVYSQSLVLFQMGNSKSHGFLTIFYCWNSREIVVFRYSLKITPRIPIKLLVVSIHALLECDPKRFDRLCHHLGTQWSSFGRGFLGRSFKHDDEKWSNMVVCYPICQTWMVYLHILTIYWPIFV